MKKRGIFFNLIFVLLIIIVLLHSAQLFARAGGGHSYGGSSHSSSHSFSGSYGGSRSGGGGGGDLFVLIMLLIQYPYIGIPVIAGGILFFYLMGRGANNYRINSTIRKASGLSVAQEKMLKEQNLAKIKESDPNFSEDKFIERAKSSFMIVQKCWSDQNLMPMKPFTSNGVFSRFSIQIDIQKESGFRNQLDDITILDASIQAVTSDNIYDRIDVMFTAMINDKDVDLKTGKVIRTNESSPFIEFWTFLRRRGAKTQSKSGLLEGKCPNCGGDIKITESGNCEYCNAFVSSGEYDWVLTEITQEEEYSSPYLQQNIIGLEDMMKKDIDFNVAVIEDKVSTIFFRIVRANYFGDVKYIKEVSHPNFYNTLSTAFNPANEWYPSLEDVAVGAVETKRITVNGSDGYDRVEVMIRWSGSYCERNRRTKELRNVGEPSIRTQVYTLIRKSDVKTPGRYNFRTIPCRSCGAPLTQNTEDRCEYCGAVINDGSRDWVLYAVDIYRPYNYNVQYTGVVKSSEENYVMLSAMISAMLSDGVIDEREKDMIYRAAQNRGIPPAVVSQMIESAKRRELIAIPSNTEEARGMLASMARIALADGKISGAEYKLLLNFGAKYNFQKADIDIIINNQRRLLFQEAKEIIKNTKIK
jgi:predicted lipid-binding transport protein (Tim44 family)/tellurite resistance protein